MLENRNLKKDLFAIGLLACVVFLAVALVTYHPADPIEAPITPLNLVYSPDQLVQPANESISNRCGYCGALIADAMFNGLGLGAYFLVFSLGVVDVALLRRQGLQAPWMRSIGWLVTLIGMTSILSLIIPSLSIGPVVGSGGYLGALTSGLLRTQFATFGAVVLSLSVFSCGLLLYTDYGVLKVARFAILVPAIALLSASDRFGFLKRNVAIDETKVVDETEAEEASEEAEEEEEEHEPAIKILGRKTTKSADEVEADAEEGEAEEELEDEEEVSDEAEAEDEEEYEEEEEAEEEEEELVVKAHTTKKAEQPKTVHQQPHFKVKKPEKSERDVVMSQLNEASRGELMQDYELPDLELLNETEDFCFDDQEKEVRIKAKILEKTFGEFGFKVKVVEIETGPVIAQYEIQLEAGLRLSKITGLADDLAIALRVPSVRIVAPIPGKNTVGIEVPNEARQMVRLREVMELTDAKTRKMKIPLFLGKDVSGNPLTADLAALPHLLIAGRTGTGKSVCLNAIITSILMTRRPDEVRMLMIDPKMVELSGYARLPHLMHPVVTDMKKAEAILAWAVEKMEERYALLARAGVRHITSYNQLGEEELLRRLEPEDDEERANIPLHLPFIVIVADEIADLMMTAGKEVEQHIIRLAQKSRAVGIHLILATQKPTVDVITGLIKSNLPARISFQVASRTDSRVVLDEMGAERLLGNGDMLFLWPGTSMLLRGQGTYLDDEEIDTITNEVSTGEQNFVNELVNLEVEKEDDESEDRFAQLKKRDDLYESAVDIVVREGRGSVSLLQRSLGIGYGRAARLIDFMAEDNIVGPYAGSQARDVLVSVEEWDTMQGLTTDNASPAPPKRSNKIVPEPDEVEEIEDELSGESDDVADLEEESFADAETEEGVETDEDEADDDEPHDSGPPASSDSPKSRRGRRGRPSSNDSSDSDDDGGLPLKAPHWNGGAKPSRLAKSKRRKRARATQAIGAMHEAASWEDQESDWSVAGQDQLDNDDYEGDEVFDDGATDTASRSAAPVRNRFKIVDEVEDDSVEDLDLESDEESSEGLDDIPVKTAASRVASGKRKRFDEASLKIASASEDLAEEDYEIEDDEIEEDEYDEDEFAEDEYDDSVVSEDEEYEDDEAEVEEEDEEEEEEDSDVDEYEEEGDEEEEYEEEVEDEYDDELEEDELEEDEEEYEEEDEEELEEEEADDEDVGEEEEEEEEYDDEYDEDGEEEYEYEEEEEEEDSK